MVIGKADGQEWGKLQILSYRRSWTTPILVTYSEDENEQKYSTKQSAKEEERMQEDSPIEESLQEWEHSSFHAAQVEHRDKPGQKNDQQFHPENVESGIN